MSAITIFILIGFAHWCAHIMHCDICKRTIAANTFFFLEGAIRVFGWPIQLIEYVRDMIKSPKPETNTDWSLLKRIERRDGETMDEFIKRATKEALEENDK